MFPVARAAQSLVGYFRFLPPTPSIFNPIIDARGIQHTAVRQAHRKHEPNFHDKYGTMVLLGGASVFSTVWGYVFTQLNVAWGFSPVGRVTPREWRE